MTGTPALSRRHLLFSAGSGVLGVAIVGTVAACSSASEDSAASADDGSPADGATSGGSPTPSSDDSSATNELSWKRVDLSFVSAYLLIRGSEVAIVDLGTDQAKDSIETALSAAGTGWDAVRHVVLTHRHGDHVGGLASVAPLVNATVYAGQQDVEAITSPGSLTPVQDGEEVFGLRIIGTPGHTPGHVSVFDQATGVLVAGDALGTSDGLTGSNPQFTSDPAEAAASVKKLAALEVRTILPGHGVPLTDGAAEALRSLADSL